MFCRYTVRHSKKHYRDDWTDRCYQQSAVDADVEQTAHRQLRDPAEVEVEQIHSVEEALVHVRVGDVRNGSELAEKAWSKQSVGVVLAFDRLFKGCFRRRYQRRLNMLSRKFLVCPSRLGLLQYLPSWW